MAHPLDGVRAKLRRASRHLRELDRKVRAFFDAHPYSVDLEPHDDPAYAGWYRCWFRVNREPPIELGVIAGEVFAQYRSALDHLMTQLTRVNGTRYGHFPIYPEGRFWQVGKGKATRSPKERMADLVRPEHLAILERLQEPQVPRSRRYSPRVPTHRGLLLTQWVANLDKHELVRPAFFSPSHVAMSHRPNVADFTLLWNPTTNLAHETELYRVRFVTEQDMEVPFRLDIDLTFGEAPYAWLNVERMRFTGQQVRRVMRRFVRVTPEFG